MRAFGAEFPAEPLWADQAAFAAQVRALDALAVWPDAVKSFREPDNWAMRIAEPVVKANANPAAVQVALSVFDGVIQDCVATGKPGGQQLALSASRALIAAISPKHPAWAGACCGTSACSMPTRSTSSKRTSRRAAPPRTRSSRTRRRSCSTRWPSSWPSMPSRSAAAMKAVGDHLAPWIEQGHWAVAEEAYATLAKALPEADKRQAELAVVGLWIEQVFTPAPAACGGRADGAPRTRPDAQEGPGPLLRASGRAGSGKPEVGRGPRRGGPGGRPLRGAGV